MPNNNPPHLAWHETLELHELVAFQSIGLMKIKKALPEVTDPALKALYQQSIIAISNNLNELIRFYQMAPSADRVEVDRQEDLPFYAGDLLALAKTSVRNYAIAVTETATPMLREVLTKHLLAAVKLHGMVYQYMYQKGMYNSYDLTQLLQNDVNLAQKALSK